MGDDVPLYQAKAELFRTLGHPIRIRVLELLQDGPKPVHELLAGLPVEASNFSQQLAALRRIGLVASTREGSTVLYSLSNPHVGELLLVGRRILAAMWTDTEDMLTRLREDTDLMPDEGMHPRTSSQRRRAGTTRRL
ncbi:MAG TPA: metalloregulator ArsR/SmtB family transcription factor [Sporichthyaceae bacterium]|jgi:ArsR family transcriptional regulator|nr:metalloregulator ArsR/SmtB family transcription factor [Sporichthyaceae bacterium]